MKTLIKYAYHTNPYRFKANGKNEAFSEARSKRQEEMHKILRLMRTMYVIDLD